MGTTAPTVRTDEGAIPAMTVPEIVAVPVAAGAGTVGVGFALGAAGEGDDDVRLHALIASAANATNIFRRVPLICIPTGLLP